MINTLEPEAGSLMLAKRALGTFSRKECTCSLTVGINKIAFISELGENVGPLPHCSCLKEKQPCVWDIVSSFVLHQNISSIPCLLLAKKEFKYLLESPRYYHFPLLFWGRF